jgi:hypothetical protein
MLFISGIGSELRPFTFTFRYSLHRLVPSLVLAFGYAATSNLRGV